MRKLNNWFPVFGGFLYISSILYILLGGDIIFSPGYGSVQVFFILLVLAILLPSFDIILSRSESVIKFYPSAAFMAIIILTMMIDLKFLIPFIFQTLSLLILFRYILKKSDYPAYHFSYVIFIIILFFLPNILRFSIAEYTPQILVFSIADDANIIGIPLLFQYGIVIASPYYFVLTLSIQFSIIIFILGFFLMENVREILSISGRKAQDVSGVVSVSFSLLSCQCETVTSIIPAIGAEVLGFISIPLIIESLLLSFTTYILLKNQKKGKKPLIFEKMWNADIVSNWLVIMTIFAIVALPVLITIISYLGYQRNIYIYFTSNVGILIATYFFIYVLQKSMSWNIFRVKGYIYALFSIFLIILMSVWYVPAVLMATVSNGVLYGVMGVASSLSGILLFMMVHTLDKQTKAIAYEYSAGMFPVIFAILFYYLIISTTSVWPIYSYTDQIIFALSLLGVSLIPMWLFVNYSIYARFWHNKA